MNTPKAMSLDEKELVKFIADKLNSFGFIEAERKCYTPKYGDDAYTIEDWDARTVGIFLAQDLLSLFSQWADEQRVNELQSLVVNYMADMDEVFPAEVKDYIQDRIKTLTGGEE